VRAYRKIIQGRACPVAVVATAVGLRLLSRWAVVPSGGEAGVFGMLAGGLAAPEIWFLAALPTATR
jgi:hypothetical protein